MQKTFKVALIQGVVNKVHSLLLVTGDVTRTGDIMDCRKDWPQGFELCPYFKTDVVRSLYVESKAEANKIYTSLKNSFKGRLFKANTPLCNKLVREFTNLRYKK